MGENEDAQFVAELIHETLYGANNVGEPFDGVFIDPEHATVRVTWRGKQFDAKVVAVESGGDER